MGVPQNGCFKEFSNLKWMVWMIWFGGLVMGGTSKIIHLKRIFRKVPNLKWSPGYPRDYRHPVLDVGCRCWSQELWELRWFQPVHHLAGLNMCGPTLWKKKLGTWWLKHETWRFTMGCIAELCQAVLWLRHTERFMFFVGYNRWAQGSTQVTLGSTWLSSRPTHAIQMT